MHAVLSSVTSFRDHILTFHGRSFRVSVRVISSIMKLSFLRLETLLIQTDLIHGEYQVGASHTTSAVTADRRGIKISRILKSECKGSLRNDLPLDFLPLGSALYASLW